MLNESSGVLHPTHKRKAAQRKQKARSVKRLNTLAKRHTKTLRKTND
jgi:hypothetical protein